MSNNVESRLYIKGDPVAISEFLVSMQDADNSFLMARGPVMDVDYPLEEGSSIGQWKEKYWGCKSHDESVEVTKLDWSSIPKEEYAYNTSEQVRISFETPWSPPLEGITYIANKLKNLEFKIFYEDNNLGYIGVVQWDKGIVIENWSHSIDGEAI